MLLALPQAPSGQEASEGAVQLQVQERPAEPAVGLVLGGGEHDPALLSDEGLDQEAGVATRRQVQDAVSLGEGETRTLGAAIRAAR